MNRTDARIIGTGVARTGNRKAAFKTTVGLALVCAGGLAAASSTAPSRAVPPPPKPESVQIQSLPLPPTAPSDAAGTCTSAINPRGTGCMSAQIDAIIEGPAYTWDGQHVLLAVEYAGAPASAGAGSIYDGPQVIAIKTDGGHFPNGDPWKCITCGIPATTLEGANFSTQGTGVLANPAHKRALMVDHPQAFPGDRKILAGTNILDCGTLKITDDACTPDRVRVYPIRWNTSADGSGPGGAIRELRLNPDGVHLMWSHMNRTTGELDQHGLVGRLAFNPAPRTGESRVPRYDLDDVYVLTSTGKPEYAPFRADPKNPGRLILNPVQGTIGEARGWTRDGKDAVGMGQAESGNVDMYITELKSGASHRLTSAPGYADPILMSPDDKWFVVFDNRSSDRHMYYGAMQGIPPLLDQLTRMIMLNSTYGYRNGMRRFFQPFLIDRAGDRGGYAGQQLNAGDGTPGSPSDPNWNARADPAWSPDGTAVVYWQALVTTPDCGGANPLPCPVSTEPGGRHSRLMIARLPDRKPLPLGHVAKPGRLTVPWGVPYKPGDSMPTRYPSLPAGKFTLQGRVGGSAQVEVRTTENGRLTFISANYERYTDDGAHIIDGTESAEMVPGTGLPRIIWHSDLRSSGQQVGTKKSTEPGGFIMSVTGQPLEGDLVTTIDGKTYRRPQPGT
ncbi:hypothetical protein MOK15_05345 [Sphingobium sp. BYY-5]|uniref:hypothetical protein n=1 Tax=Sphingobium sp. BYY-5 TaxID=2926400 RepID=UPI001FA80D94|nr:hypothetical protein [Sphingobium sp. BYY-5]MCI4589516.1 hypothetical protein [Sphingobium sp. BYY-5]